MFNINQGEIQLMTIHELITANSNNMKTIKSNSVNLIVTSPPYPMIEMWDKTYCNQDPSIENALKNGEGITAFTKMHNILNAIWKECNRVLTDNGFICINIGDATRTIKDNFQLYSNHTQILNHFLSMGYNVLPDILWRKPSNSPNKFMGSGMYPAGAYVTYEHEYILIFRKGTKRIFKGKEKLLRQKSAFFWEERNVWFSDLWEINGITQNINHIKFSSRQRSASFPFEIPYRLINMYSSEGDYVLDPFSGLGITTLAAMASNRNSYSIEIDPHIASLAKDNIKNMSKGLNDVINSRIANHLKFIESLSEETRNKCYENNPHGFLVKTKQETSIKIDKIQSMDFKNNTISCEYA